MGSGKTTLVELLKRTGPKEVKYRDLDQAIVKTHGPIAELMGQGTFRDVEQQVLRELTGERAIIALGGGTALPGEGEVAVWLDVPFERCWERIRGDTARPLVKRGKMFLQELYQKRRELYAKADVRFDEGILKRITCYGEFERAILKGDGSFNPRLQT